MIFHPNVERTAAKHPSEVQITTPKKELNVNGVVTKLLSSTWQTIKENV
tara:strand:- start:1049 stop:1195 length:147 start_codon:yes stop_codon:yes gene_type:complete